MSIGCINTKKPLYTEKVDTSTKKIEHQKKGIFELKKLNLHISNNFDGARLNGLTYLNDSTINILITPENTPIMNSPYYSFKIWSNETKNVHLNFDYPDGYTHRYVPKLKRNNTKWERYQTDSGKNSTIYKVKVSKDTTWVSAQEVVSSKDTYSWIEDILKNKTTIAHHSIIGISPLGKNIPVIDIFKGSPKKKDIIILFTRQHPPEVTGFFAFQEFLETILANSELSNNFLTNYRVIAFPIINPDGVDLGNWRHNSGGIDLNRDWLNYKQPEIRLITNYIKKTLRKSKGKIILGLDFHSTFDDVFYTNIERKNTTLPNFTNRWFNQIEASIPAYTVNEKPGKSKKPVSKAWFLKKYAAVGITYEIGDETPRTRIIEIGKASATAMMKILNEFK